MEGFIQFVKMLFLGKALLLTPTPIDLNEYWTEIPLEKPLSAITAGAAVEVRFGKDHHYFKGSKDIMTASKIADDLLPTGTFEAEMIDRQGNILIADKRNILLVNEHAKYGITGDKPFPLDAEYTKLRIRSTKPIQGVQIYWKNFRL